jgi:hypothetical protein
MAKHFSMRIGQKLFFFEPIQLWKKMIEKLFSSFPFKNGTWH